MTLQKRVDDVIANALEKRIVGCVVLARQNGKEIYAGVAGFADRKTKRVMQRDAIFRLASVTKPIVATTALCMMELGLLGLDDVVTKYLPWFTPKSPDGTTQPITIRQLLSHSSGVHYDMPSHVSTGLSGPLISLEENLRYIAELPLAFAPGSAWTYGMGIDVIGGIIAAIENSSLEDAVVKYVCNPLSMTDTRFSVTDNNRLAVPYADSIPPQRMGEPEHVTDQAGNTVVFSPQRILQSDAPQSGGAGMAGTADDVMTLLECYHGTNAFLKSSTIKEAMANQIGALPRSEADAGKRFSLIGAVLDDPKATRTPSAIGTVDWGGAWGHNWLVDPINKITIVICTNVAFEGCNGPFTEEIRDAVYG